MELEGPWAPWRPTGPQSWTLQTLMDVAKNGSVDCESVDLAQGQREMDRGSALTGSCGDESVLGLVGRRLGLVVALARTAGRPSSSLSLVELIGGVSGSSASLNQNTDYLSRSYSQSRQLGEETSDLLPEHLSL